MYRKANDLLFFLTAAGLAVASLLSACTNDLKKIQEISQKVVNSPADTTRGVDIIYSDSAKVKAHVFAPLMLEYQKDGNPVRTVMPKGVKIIIYDNNLQLQGTIVADTAYYLNVQQIMQLRKNVVLTSAKGDVFESEELNYDMFNKKINSTKPVDITMANGNKSHGTSLVTNELFSPITIENQTGLIYIDSKFGK